MWISCKYSLETLSIRGLRELHYSAGDPDLVQIQLSAQLEQQHELIVSF